MFQTSPVKVSNIQFSFTAHLFFETEVLHYKNPLQRKIWHSVNNSVVRPPKENQ